MNEELDLNKIEEELKKIFPWPYRILDKDHPVYIKMMENEEDQKKMIQSNFVGQSYERIAALVKRIKEQDKLIDNFKKYQKEHWMKFMSLEHNIKTLKKLIAHDLVSLEMPREIIDLKVIEAAFYLKCKDSDDTGN